MTCETDCSPEDFLSVQLEMNERVIRACLLNALVAQSETSTYVQKRLEELKARTKTITDKIEAKKLETIKESI